MTAAKKLFSIIEFYAIESSIHGVKYIGNSKYSRIVRAFWLFVFIFSMAGFSYYATQVYKKWFIDPDIVITTKLQNVREIPFPAFTICPIRKLKKEFLNFEEIKTNQMSLSTDDRKYLETLIHLQVENYNWPNFEDVIVNATLESNKTIEMIQTTSYDINESLFRCFSQEEIPFVCKEKYQKVLTSEGYCFTFNALDYHSIFNENVLHEDFDGYKNGKSSNWSPTNGYSKTALDEYPLRILGTSVGFDVAMVLNVDDNNISGEIRLAFHLPNEIVGSISKVKFLNYNLDNQLVLNVREHRMDESLRRYQPEKRQCYFDNERKLQFYKHYTKDNCFHECLINYTRNACGCVKFSMLREKHTQICNVTKLRCYLSALSNWPDKDEASATTEFPCNCLPSCNAIYYDLLRLDVFDTYESYTKLSFKNTSNIRLTRISAYVEDFLFLQQRQYVAYKLQNLVADFGGLLGLFIGCSLITIVEIFYLAIVSCFGIRKNKRLKRQLVKPQPRSLPLFVIERERRHFRSQCIEDTTITEHQQARNMHYGVSH